MNYEDLKNKLSKREDYQEAEKRYEIAFSVAKMIMDARAELDITQKELALRLGTKQPSIARIENGDSVPTIPFLDRIAKALGTKLVMPRFEFTAENYELRGVNNETETCVIVIDRSDYSYSHPYSSVQNQIIQES